MSEIYAQYAVAVLAATTQIVAAYDACSGFDRQVRVLQKGLSKRAAPLTKRVD